jgi:hypothetical protein
VILEAVSALSTYTRMAERTGDGLLFYLSTGKNPRQGGVKKALNSTQPLLVPSWVVKLRASATSVVLFPHCFSVSAQRLLSSPPDAAYTDSLMRASVSLTEPVPRNLSSCQADRGGLTWSVDLRRSIERGFGELGKKSSVSGRA